MNNAQRRIVARLSYLLAAVLSTWMLLLPFLGYRRELAEYHRKTEEYKAEQGAVFKKYMFPPTAPDFPQPMNVVIGILAPIVLIGAGRFVSVGGRESR